MDAPLRQLTKLSKVYSASPQLPRLSADVFKWDPRFITPQKRKTHQQPAGQGWNVSSCEQWLLNPQPHSMKYWLFHRDSQSMDCTKPKILERITPYSQQSTGFSSHCSCGFSLSPSITCRQENGDSSPKIKCKKHKKQIVEWIWTKVRSFFSLFLQRFLACPLVSFCQSQLMIERLSFRFGGSCWVEFLFWAELGLTFGGFFLRFFAGNPWTLIQENRISCKFAPLKPDQRNLHDNPSHLEREIRPTKREDQKKNWLSQSVFTFFKAVALCHPTPPTVSTGVRNMPERHQ